MENSGNSQCSWQNQPNLGGTGGGHVPSILLTLLSLVLREVFIETLKPCCISFQNLLPKPSGLPSTWCSPDISKQLPGPHSWNPIALNLSTSQQGSWPFHAWAVGCDHSALLSSASSSLAHSFLLPPPSSDYNLLRTSVFRTASELQGRSIQYIAKYEGIGLDEALSSLWPLSVTCSSLCATFEPPMSPLSVYIP